MAVAEVDLEMDDLFGEGRDGEELLDQPAEQRELDDEAQEVPGPGEGQAQGNIFRFVQQPTIFLKELQKRKFGCHHKKSLLIKMFNLQRARAMWKF